MHTPPVHAHQPLVHPRCHVAFSHPCTFAFTHPLTHSFKLMHPLTHRWIQSPSTHQFTCTCKHTPTHPWKHTVAHTCKHTAAIHAGMQPPIHSPTHPCHQRKCKRMCITASPYLFTGRRQLVWLCRLNDEVINNGLEVCDLPQHRNLPILEKENCFNLAHLAKPANGCPLPPAPKVSLQGSKDTISHLLACKSRIKPSRASRSKSNLLATAAHSLLQDSNVATDWF